MEHVFIVNYSAIDSSRIEEAADRIAQSIEEAQETASQRDCAG
jgi:DNA-binding transcriptional MocR family regulator